MRIDSESFTELLSCLNPCANKLLFEEAFEIGSILLPFLQISHHLKDSVSNVLFIFNGEIGRVVITFLTSYVQNLQVSAAGIPQAVLDELIKSTLLADN